MLNWFIYQTVMSKFLNLGNWNLRKYENFHKFRSFRKTTLFMRKNDSCRIHAGILKSLFSKLTGLERLACQKGQFSWVSRSNPPFELLSGLVKQEMTYGYFHVLCEQNWPKQHLNVYDTTKLLASQVSARSRLNVLAEDRSLQGCELWTNSGTGAAVT